MDENLSKIESHIRCIRPLCDSYSQNHGKSVENQASITAYQGKIIENNRKTIEIQGKSMIIDQNPFKINENRSKTDQIQH